MSATAIILAAGKSTRMNSMRAKPLHEVCGRPMLWHVLSACYEAGCNKVMVVIGHAKDQIMAQFADDRRIIWVEQPEQLGSGDAARMCTKQLTRLGGDVFVLGADVPLIRGQALQTLLQVHREEKAAGSLATAIFDNPSGYARVIRDAQGQFSQVVDEAQATSDQRSIREIFPGYYCFRAKDLISALEKLPRNRRKREYQLIDTFAVLKDLGRKVVAVQAVAPDDTLSVNTRQQLAEIDLLMQDRLQRQARESGVTIVNGFNTYIESGATIGKDTVIQPFSFIGRDAVIGADCVIGPFGRIPRDAVIPEGTRILGHPAQDTGMVI